MKAQYESQIDEVVWEKDNNKRGSTIRAKGMITYSPREKEILKNLNNPGLICMWIGMTVCSLVVDGFWCRMPSKLGSMLEKIISQA